jgi:hypothetical protein
MQVPPDEDETPVEFDGTDAERGIVADADDKRHVRIWPPTPPTQPGGEASGAQRPKKPRTTVRK